MIYVDTRERSPVRLLVSATVDGDTTERALPSGDFLIFDAAGHSLAIERKTEGDLLSSLGTKMANGEVRLFDQLRRMRETYDHTLLIIEGIPRFDRAQHTLGRTGWSHGAVQMLLLRVERDGTLIAYTDNLYATADLLRIFNNRAALGCALPGGTPQEAA